MILTLPDNPTGTIANESAIKRVCEIAEEEQLTIISDEIYRDLVHDGSQFTSPASYLPEATIVISGLSKSLALGGWRIGMARVPDDPSGRHLREQIMGIASEIWSGMSAPMQQVAAYAFTDPMPVLKRIERSRKLHGQVAREVNRRLKRVGVDARPPTAAFYLYADFERHRDALAHIGIASGAQLCEYLFRECDVAALAGIEFGDRPGALRCRFATSHLYGVGEERLEALDSATPLQLPWIEENMERLSEALARLITWDPCSQ